MKSRWRATSIGHTMFRSSGASGMEMNKIRPMIMYTAIGAGYVRISRRMGVRILKVCTNFLLNCILLTESFLFSSLICLVSSKIYFKRVFGALKLFITRFFQSVRLNCSCFHFFFIKFERNSWFGRRGFF